MSREPAEDLTRRAEGWADKSLRGEALSTAEALALLKWPGEAILTLLNAAFRVRRRCWGREVKLHYIMNLQSGLCSEDCSYCAQSKVSQAPIARYRRIQVDSIVQAAEQAVDNKAAKLCLVAAMRGPSDRDIDRVAVAVKRVKSRYPHLEICASLGILSDRQAKRLKEAGVGTYNHNLNTSERYYTSICRTHSFQDRLDTIQRSRDAGLLSCSGAVFGMGETDRDVVAVALRVRGLQVESIPVNFLIPIAGTPLADHHQLTPYRCLKILCLFRLLCPRAELRVAGGRELQLRSLQPLALYPANSIFVGGYLTTAGREESLDIAMIRDMGFTIAGEKNPSDATFPESRPLKDQVKLLAGQ